LQVRLFLFSIFLFGTLTSVARRERLDASTANDITKLAGISIPEFRMCYSAVFVDICVDPVRDLSMSIVRDHQQSAADSRPVQSVLGHLLHSMTIAIEFDHHRSIFDWTIGVGFPEIMDQGNLL
jgi:hypothetical protein